MRINLTKKNLVNLVYMQLGFSKQISENLIDDFLATIVINIKSESAYKTIGEVAKILKLQVNKKGTLPTHIIRFWETQFKQIKPKIFNSNRRYYDEKTVNLLKKVRFLLKEQGMTINGVKKILDSEVSLELDEMADKSIKAEKLINKLIKISNILKTLK